VHLFEQGEILGNEARLENEILRRISGDRQLRRQHQFRACRSETLISANDQLTITGQIAHGRVDLRKTNLHIALGQIMRNIASGKSRSTKGSKKRETSSLRLVIASGFAMVQPCISAWLDSTTGA
jgi:hypothetical protein